MFIATILFEIFVASEAGFTDHPELYYTNFKDLLKIDLETLTKELVVTAENLVGLDYHYEKQVMFFADTTTEIIYSIPMNDSSLMKIFIKHNNQYNIEAPVGLAVDWINDRLYWTDLRRKEIAVVDLDGKNQRSLITDNLEEPRAIVLNPFDGWMFWSDRSSGSPKIEKARLNGTRRTALIEKDILRPNALTIDFYTTTIFWADSGLKTISCSDYNGKNRKVILYSPHLLTNTYSIDIFDNSLFWTYRDGKAILKVNKFTGTDISYMDIIHSRYEPLVLRIVHETKQPKMRPNITQIGTKKEFELRSSLERFSETPCNCTSTSLTTYYETTFNPAPERKNSNKTVKEMLLNLSNNKESAHYKATIKSEYSASSIAGIVFGAILIFMLFQLLVVHYYFKPWRKSNKRMLSAIYEVEKEIGNFNKQTEYVSKELIMFDDNINK